MLVRALFLRPARRKPWRAALTVLGVAAGVGAVVATVAASRAAVASLEEGVEEIAGRARLEVTAAGGIDESLLGRLRPAAADAVLAPVIEEVALLPQLGDTVRVLGVDPLVDLAARDLELVPGPGGGPEVFERLLRGEGVLLPEPLASRLGGANALVLSVRARPEALPVLGVLRPRALSAAWDRVVIADVALAQELFGRHGRLDRIEVVPRPGVSEAEVRARLSALLPGGVRVEEPAARGARAGRMVRALEFNLTALSGVSLFVGAVLVATTLATAVVQRRYLIALAVSLGAQRRQIARVVLAEALLIGLAGGALGVLAGRFGAQAALSSVRATVATVAADATAASIELPPWLALLGVVLGVGVSVAAASLPLSEAVRTPPLQNLRAERPWALGRRARRRAVALSAACAAGAFGLTRLPPLNDLPVA
ncbi:MAG: ABC transporter permease, partial [Acidobacteriota bacterium]